MSTGDGSVKMSRDDISAMVREYVEKITGAPAGFTETDSLARHGLDSLGSVELTLSLEDGFGITFEDAELSFENFETIAGIVDLVHSKVSDHG